MTRLLPTIGTKPRGLVRMPGAMLAMLLAASGLLAGCDDQKTISSTEPPTIVKRSISAPELARQLRMNVTSATSAAVTLRNVGNSVVLYADPEGQAFVNGQAVGTAGGFTMVGETMYVPEDLIRTIRDVLRPGPEVVPPQFPPGLPPNPPPVRQVKGRVVIDAGHGGTDDGTTAAGRANPEKDINLSVATAIVQALRRRGVEVTVTRPDDHKIELDDRVAIANRSGASLFVSIHSDSSDNRSNQGHTVIMPASGGPDTLALANAISARLTAAGSPVHGVRKDVRGLRVLKYTKITAVLVELGFLTNAQDITRLTDRGSQLRLAEGIADGICDYLKK